jgi:hypothetical protein
MRVAIGHTKAICQSLNLPLLSVSLLGRMRTRGARYEFSVSWGKSISSGRAGAMAISCDMIAPLFQRPGRSPIASAL